MKNIQKRFGRFWLITGLVIGLFAGLGLVVQAGTPLGVAGYLDFSYSSPGVVNDPTGEKPESKLWWNDGFWWGSLFSPTAGEYRIHRLNWGTQTWEDTGVTLDTRDDTKADVLWDQANHKLYVVSHLYSDLGSVVSSQLNYGKLFRYTYDPIGQTYTLDPGFPTNVNKDKGESLVIAQERSNAQRLWVTYVSRVPPALDYHVYVNRSTDSGATWDTPIILPFAAEAATAQSDIASIIAFNDGGNKVGVVWENTLTGALYMATHVDGDAPGNWTLETIPLPKPPDDHISLKGLHTTSTGHVFAAIKTAAVISDTTAPEIGMVVRNPGGAYSFHQYSPRSSNDTRPISVIEEGNNPDPNVTTDDKAYIFVTGKTGGSKICYQAAVVNDLITNPASTFPNPNADCGTSFIEDSTYHLLDNATSSKHNVNATTGLVILASNSITPLVYVHNVLGDPPPVVTALSPSRNMTDVVFNTGIQVSFSRPMNLNTFNTSTFIVDDGTGPRPGTFTIDASGLVVTFQPATPLKASTVYTVRLTTGILDVGGRQLFQRAAFAADPVNREQWSFTTAAPTVQFSAASYSVTENGVTATITATLNMTSSLAATVDYATSDGTALAGTDYTATNGTLTFNPGELIMTFTVAVMDDAVNEGNKSANLTLSNPTNAILGVSTAPLTILDDEGPPTVQFSAIAYTVAENDASGKATISVNLSHGDPGTITVDYTISDGTANGGGVDYTVANGTLTFNPTETSKSFDITLNNETMFEADETVNLALGTVIPGTVLVNGPNPVVLTIQNDDAMPAVQFNNAAYSAGEETLTGAAVVTLTNPSAFPVTVDVATSNGTAVTPDDYTANSTTLTFAPGVTSQPFNVALVDDLLDEADELVNLGLSNAVSATLGAQASTLLTIVDNDNPPTVQLSAATYTVGEGAGSATITLNLSAASGKVVTVDYVMSDGTATAGSDYTAANGTVTFDPGQTSQTFSVAVTNDAIDEADETVNLTLGISPVNATLGAPATATLTITDNDPAPTVQFAPVENVNENAGTATVTVFLSAASGKTVTVGYATSNDTATAGSDYTAASGTLTFNPGQISQTFTVPVAEDALDEPNETINLALSVPSNATLGTLATATLAIVDNDGAPTVQFKAAMYAINEDGGTATISVTLSAPSSNAVTVDYATSAGTATGGGVDYTGATGTLTFAPGELSKSFPVGITDDAEDEQDETVNLALSNPQNAALATPSNATLNIIDNENRPAVEFSVATYTVNEGDGTATIEVKLSAPSSDAVTIDYATSAGTATPGVDYTETSGTLTFPAGQLSQTFTVSVADDGDDDNEETINLALSNPSNNAQRGAQRNAELIITDNDGPPTVQFSAATYTVNEEGGAATITVELSNPAAQVVTVDYGTGNGTAVAGVDFDYTAASGTLTFNPGETSQTFTVAIADDALDEADETIMLGLSNPSNTTDGLGTLDTAILTIVDNEASVQFSAATYTVNENAGTATITVKLSDELAQAVTVGYATSAGTATGGGVDYTGANGTLTFAAGETSKTFTVAITDDSADEQDETINLALSNPTNAALGTPANATLTIVDNGSAATPTVQFSAATYTVNETGATITINVSLSTAATQPVTVGYATSNGTATAGSDYTAASGTVTFNPGETSKSFTVAVVGDALDEPNETVNLVLSNPAGATLGTLVNATLTIIDNALYLPLVHK